MRFLRNLNKLDLLFWGVFMLFSALVVWSILFKMETSFNVDGQITPPGDDKGCKIGLKGRS